MRAMKEIIFKKERDEDSRCKLLEALGRISDEFSQDERRRFLERVLLKLSSVKGIWT